MKYFRIPYEMYYCRYVYAKDEIGAINDADTLDIQDTTNIRRVGYTVAHEVGIERIMTGKRYCTRCGFWTIPNNHLGHLMDEHRIEE